MQLPAVRTGATAGNVLQALLDAGVPASGIRMVAAQSAIETAGWAQMWGWNAGNITAKDSEDYQILPGNKLHFRVFESLDDGVGALVTWLGHRGVLPYAVHGDLSGYVQRLADTCYAGCIGMTDPNGFTTTRATYDAYQSGMGAWMSKLSSVQPVRQGIGARQWAVVGALGLLALSVMKWKGVRL